MKERAFASSEANSEQFFGRNELGKSACFDVLLPLPYNSYNHLRIIYMKKKTKFHDVRVNNVTIQFSSYYYYFCETLKIPMFSTLHV